MPKDHPLFQRYPLTGRVTLSTGEAPTPYHIYAGYGLFIGGVGDTPAAMQLLNDQAVIPLQTTDGKVVMGLWICDFTEASLGPHHELQISFFVTDRAAPPIAPHPLNALTALLTRPDVLMLCHGLWNNTPHVVAYNREALSLNARLTESAITYDGRSLTFSFRDAITQQLVVAGTIHHPQRPSMQAGWALLSGMGLARSVALARQPWVGMRVLNPLGVRLNRHAIAESFTKNDGDVVRYFAPRADMLTIDAPLYRPLQFTPHVAEFMTGFKLVYLTPQ